MNRFDEKIAYEPNTGCHLWMAGCDMDGYGRFYYEGEDWKAHRFSWFLEHGPIPDGMQVLHICDVRSCVNDEHLFLGTHDDNMIDKVSKDRQARGELHGEAKLTEDDVRSIRADCRSGVAIAAAYGVGCSTVCEIRKWKLWKHVK